VNKENKLKEIIGKTKRAVVKIGSSVLVDKNDRFSHKALSGIAKGIASIQKKGVHIALVSSGAVASGMQYLGFRKKPHKISELQACAAIGQPILIQMYQRALGRAKLQAAQVLLTRDDLSDRTRFLNAKHTLSELLGRNVIPIINENDTVVVDEIRVGDNDNLAALVTNVVEADLLILLTDQDAFYTADPRKDPDATRIPVVENVDGDTFSSASDTEKALSVGGMRTKLEAAQKAAQFGIPTIIASGRDLKILDRIFAAESVGTLFLPRMDSLTARKHWIAYTLKPQGRVLIDDGARRALVEGKKSLLSSGIIRVEGKFKQGDPVQIVDREGNPFARGLVAYDSTELPLIAGKKSSEIERILGYKGPDEVIHRDDLVLL
jgi:glutamate 5-kinase